MKGVVFATAIAVLSFASANAKTVWSVERVPMIEARPSEPESDADLRAICFDGHVAVRIGGAIGVGKGNGEPVSVKIEGDGKSAKVQGVSKTTPDVEMTGGTELVTDLPLDSPAAEILFSGKVVKIVTPDQKTHTLFDADSSGAAKKFLKQCKG
ncbi:hypothetical protein [Methylocystis parvus]|uniref:Invasion associated locus B family protein n=1 Tax=Methylocystis parvus TaxID=134 RepID=A0A6B8M1R8_9HYPH|nr:hypothetical protein [Methylocystis parvus]QGM98817.1 hypothetical protein F7D14_15880 [Methylocystis parvus]WBK00834.1 hypothetical protein MMG94_03675 [Methylocystis parvus OBBP]